MARLEERNADALSAAIRKKLFSFETLASPPVRRSAAYPSRGGFHQSGYLDEIRQRARNKVFAGLSKRAAEGLKEEIELLGPVRLKDVEAAQDVIIQAVRRLEEEGQISIDADAAAVVAWIPCTTSSRTRVTASSSPFAISASPPKSSAASTL